MKQPVFDTPNITAQQALITRGFFLTFGALQCLIVSFAVLLALCGVLALSYAALGLFTDDSDFDGWHRSGLKVHTDAKTGIQYLSDGHGGLVPRLAADGQSLMHGPAAPAQP
jgi:hypothetical protein